MLRRTCLLVLEEGAGRAMLCDVHIHQPALTVLDAAVAVA
jgi:hypothetical protein